MTETATIRPNILTDGSVTYDVIYTTSDGFKITIGATSEGHAREIEQALEQAAFVFVDARAAA